MWADLVDNILNPDSTRPLPWWARVARWPVAVLAAFLNGMAVAGMLVHLLVGIDSDNHWYPRIWMPLTLILTVTGTYLLGRRGWLWVCYGLGALFPIFALLYLVVAP